MLLEVLYEESLNTCMDANSQSSEWLRYPRKSYDNGAASTSTNNGKNFIEKQLSDLKVRPRVSCSCGPLRRPKETTKENLCVVKSKMPTQLYPWAWPTTFHQPLIMDQRVLTFNAMNVL